MSIVKDICPEGRKVVVLAFREDDDLYVRMPRRVMQGVLTWGREHAWDMVKLDHWQWRVPDGVKPDGLISALPAASSEYARSLHRAIPNSVCINSQHLVGTVPEVNTNQSMVGTQAAQYYLERGFRNFAIAAFRRSNWDASLDQFMDETRSSGARCETIADLDAFNKDMAITCRLFKKRLGELQLPLAIFCFNDLLAVRLCRWTLECGLAVPEQVAILGCGDDRLACECSPVPISSVDSQPEQQGIEAARVLQAMMEGKDVSPRQILVPPKGVVTRRSTDITAIPDLAAARALRYIWDNFRNNIGPDDVAAAAGIHRRTLDRHFKAALGRTAAKEITRRRLAMACELLAADRSPVAEVAALSGFNSPQYFNYQFKRSFSVTPQRYREQATG